MSESTVVLSVIAVIHNDALLLEAFTEGLLAELRRGYRYFEVLLIDDGSTDDTAARIPALLAKTERLRYIRLARHYGNEVAFSAGLESVVGDFVITLIPGIDPPELISQFVEQCRTGSGVVVGISNIPKRASGLQKWGANLFHSYCRKTLGIDFPSDTTDYRCLSRNVVNGLTRFHDRHRYLRIFAATAGYQQVTLSYSPLPGGETKRKTTLGEDLTAAIEIIVSNSKHPLRLVSRLGLFLSFLNLLYLLYIVAVYLFKRDIAEGWTTSSLQQTTMFFFLFLILAVVCEYVGRILEETQNRPLYFVADEKHSPMSLESTMTRNIVNESV